MKIHLIEGCIQEQKVDVIVNSTSPNLDLSRGPLSTAILSAAGSGIQKECRQNYPKGITFGEIAVTSGGNMPVKEILHASLPTWNAKDKTTEEKLKDVIGKCLREANHCQYTSIAIPFLGTGERGYPPDIVAELLYQALESFHIEELPHSLTDIRVVVRKEDQQNVKAMENSKKMKKIIQPSTFFSGILSKVATACTKIVVDIAVLELTAAASVASAITKPIELLTSKGPIPETWTEEATKSLLLTSREAQGVITKMMVSLPKPPLCVKKIERIQNRPLYQQYHIQKDAMDKTNGSVDNERSLWHGTSSDAICNINANGFNRSYCGKNATLFGNGVYFAKDASYSAHYSLPDPDSEGTRHIYLAKVLTGIFTAGRPGMTDTPIRIPEKSLHFDSVVNKVEDPSMFIIFKDHAAYPEYLIAFTC